MSVETWLRTNLTGPAGRRSFALGQGVERVGGGGCEGTGSQISSEGGLFGWRLELADFHWIELLVGEGIKFGRVKGTGLSLLSQGATVCIVACGFPAACSTAAASCVASSARMGKLRGRGFPFGNGRFAFGLRLGGCRLREHRRVGA